MVELYGHLGTGDLAACSRNVNMKTVESDFITQSHTVPPVDQANPYSFRSEKRAWRMAHSMAQTQFLVLAFYVQFNVFWEL